MKKLLLLLALVAGCNARGCGVVPMGFFSTQSSPTADLTTGVPPWLHTARTGGTLYPMASSATASALGTNTHVWEDHFDGNGGGLWAFGAWDNLYPSPLAAGTMASGAHAGDDYGAGFTYHNASDFFYDFASHHAARKVNTAGTVATTSSPWSGFGNALSMASLGSNNRALEFNWDAFALPTVGGWDVEMKIKPTSVSATNAVAFGKLGCCFASHQVFFIIYTNASFYCGLTDGTNTFHLAASTTAPVANTTYDVACDYDGSNISVLVNGTVEATTATGGGTTANGLLPWYFGNNDDEGGGGVYPSDAIIDEFRISNTSRHPGNYTPATTPFTADANTLVLMHFDNLNTGYSTGYGDPLGGTNATRLLASDNATRYDLTYNAGGVGDQLTAVASAWVADDPLLTPGPTSGALSSMAGDAPFAGAVSLGTGTAFRRRITFFPKSLPLASDFNIAPAGVTVTPDPIAGYQATTSANLGAGGVRVWGPQITELSASDVPLLDGSTSAAVVSLDSSKYSNVLQPNGDLYVQVSYLHDPLFIITNGTAPTPTALFSYINGDGTTMLGFDGVASIYALVNGSSPYSDTGNAYTEPHGYYQGWGESTYSFYVRPGSDGLMGNTLRLNGCTWSGIHAGGAPTMHAPTSFYLGSNAGSAGTSWPRRYTKLSFAKFDEYQAEGLILGNSLLSEYTGVHAVVGSWIYTLPESRTRPGINNLAVIADTTSGQQTKFDASIYATDATHANAVKWVIVMETLNCINVGGTVASCSTDMQNLINDLHSKLPNAHIYLYPTIPCSNGGSCTWANVDHANACIDGGARTATCTGAGGSVITCPGGATCHIYTYAGTWGPSGSHPLDAGGGTGTMITAYNSGDQHENDPGGRVMGAEFRADLVANGDL